MNKKHLLQFLTLALCLPCTADTELTYQTVATSGQPAPGLSSNLVFDDFVFIALADDGRPGVGADLRGPGGPASYGDCRAANLGTKVEGTQPKHILSGRRMALLNRGQQARLLRQSPHVARSAV